MTSITHYGQTLTEDSLRSACHQAAVGHPKVPMSMHPMDGDQWISDLIDAVDGTPFATSVDAALASLMQTGGSDVLDVLSSVAASRPGHLPTDVLIGKLKAQSGPLGTLAKAVRDLLLNGNTGYTDDLRSLAADEDARKTLAAVFLCHDHAWTLEQLKDWFTGDTTTDRSLLLGLVSPLSRGELHALGADVVRADSPVPTAVAEQITAYVTKMADKPFFADRGDAVRWLQSA